MYFRHSYGLINLCDLERVVVRDDGKLLLWIENWPKPVRLTARDAGRLGDIMRRQRFLASLPRAWPSA